MRKDILVLLTVLAVLFLSCQSDNDSIIIPNETDVIPLSYSIIKSDGSKESFDFEYNNKFIINVSTNFGKKVSYNYANERLTSFQTIQDNDTLTTNLIYLDGRLSELRTDDDSLVINFNYGSLNQIESSERTENGETIITNYEYDEFGNVITAQGNFSTLKFLYNERNNPFKNVFPQLDPKNTWDWLGSQNNLQQEVQEKIKNENDFKVKYFYEYTFLDPNYFPIERRKFDADRNLIERVLYYYD